MDKEFSLDQLRDIVEPAPVGWWPMAPGWWVLLAAVIVTLLWASYWLWRQHNENAYRRKARLLVESARSNIEVAAILKRTALSAFPRTEVAGLTGSAWVDWLRQTGKTPIDSTAAHFLTDGEYGRQKPEVTAELRAFAINWIDTHQRPGIGKEPQSTAGEEVSAC